MKKKILALLIAILISIYKNTPAKTATCKCSPTSITIKNNMQKSLKNNDIVVHGTVIDIINIDSVHYIAQIKNNKTWLPKYKKNTIYKKNNNIFDKLLNNKLNYKQNNALNRPTDELYYYIISSQNPEDCSPIFNIGWNYLIYAKKYNNLLITSICSRTAIARKLEMDIKKLNNTNNSN